MNVDASFHEDSGSGGTGAIIRDDHTFFLAAGNCDIPFIDDAATVEARALLNSLILA